MNHLSKAQIKWDKRYQAKADTTTLPLPPEYIQKNWQQLKVGRLLDVAAGDGAVSLYLADKGFSMSAVDISAVGLNLLAKNMQGLGSEVTTCEMDLESALVDLSSLGMFDSIVISRYKPVEPLWAALIRQLKPGGTLLVTTFNLMHHQRTGFSERFCLGVDEYTERFDELMLLKHESDIDLSGEDSYLFVKK